jgi:hypothetical protein
MGVHQFVQKSQRGWGGMDWIDLAQDTDQWRALVNTVMNAIQISCSWILSTVLFLFKTRFGDWILSPSSGKTYSVVF